MRFYDKTMIFQGVKPTIQRFEVGDVNRPNMAHALLNYYLLAVVVFAPRLVAPMVMVW